ncbi:VRR-NUC domain-containing protein [Enterovibrio norvegicus]|uniref:VRR-NUC domain-containing protein n=1 Tax=Enterovibrio norvegicus TaxID=188144 RepID=UPI00389B2C77
MTDTAVFPDLPPHYYLANFASIIDTVTLRYGDLLTQEEGDWITAFHDLPTNAQCLLVRFLSRKGHWFREDKLNYPEIDNLPHAISSLAEATFIDIERTPPFDVLCSLLTKPELLSHFDVLPLDKKSKKADLIEEIATHSPTAEPLTFSCLHVRLDVMPIFLLLYFGNARQDLSQFVLSDLGIQRFESVSLSAEVRLFTSRDQMKDWLDLSSLSEQYWQLSEKKDKHALLELSKALPFTTAWPPLERKRQRLINQLAREQERAGNIEEAMLLFSQSSLPPSRERQARIAMKQSDWSRACEWVNDMLASPFNEDEKDVAARIAKQLAKKTDFDCPVATEHLYEALHLSLPLDTRVEVASAAHFTEQGWTVWFSENLLLNALFGLTFWDIIYSPVSGAFLNPFQRSPRDMFSSEFYTARQSAIEERLHALAQQTQEESVKQRLATFEQKYGLANDWIVWGYIDKEQITAALLSLTPPQLVACFERILFDPKSNRAGHPDLFMVKGNTCQFIEVKGPGDKLQHHQVRWLNFLNSHHIISKVLYVEDANKSPCSNANS